MPNWTYPVTINAKDGDLAVSVRDLPEVVTSGDTREQALEFAADAIEVAVAVRMERDQELPEPSRVRKGEHPVSLPAQLAAKASVYAAWKKAKITKVEFARRLGRNEVEVRRILNPRYGTKLDQLEEAARALGGRLVVEFQTAA
jgi:antitoxin HicB